MTDAQMLDQLDRTNFVPAAPEDLEPIQLAGLALVSVDDVANLSVTAEELEPHGRT